MPKVTRIELHLQTGGQRNAGTDGDIYLGICGREFYIDSPEDDFETGATRTYVFAGAAATGTSCTRSSTTPLRTT